MPNKSSITSPIRRETEIKRETAETQISLSLNLDGQGKTQIATGFGFLDHILTLLAFWARFDLTLEASGDLEIDAHHLTEDCGLALGLALEKALGDKCGITRVGFARVPMDESLVEVTLDLSGRAWLEYRGAEFLPPIIAKEEADLWREFYKSLAFKTNCNLHINFLYGQNGHHLIEASAKALGLALKMACTIQDNLLPSTKKFI